MSNKPKSEAKFCSPFLEQPMGIHIILLTLHYLCKMIGRDGEVLQAWLPTVWGWQSVSSYSTDTTIDTKSTPEHLQENSSWRGADGLNRIQARLKWMHPSTAKIRDEKEDFFKQLLETSSPPLWKSTLPTFVKAAPWVWHLAKSDCLGGISNPRICHLWAGLQ